MTSGTTLTSRLMVYTGILEVIGSSIGPVVTKLSFWCNLGERGA